MVNTMLTWVILVPTLLIVSVCAVACVYPSKTTNNLVDDSSK
jgi:hypothetical protein